MAAGPWLSAALHLSLPVRLMGGQELSGRVLLRADGIVWVW